MTTTLSISNPSSIKEHPLQVMKISFLIMVCILLPAIVNSQDYIYKKDKSVQSGKILEVTTDKIKYKKAEIPKGPTYEISISNVIKIRYSSGYTDYFEVEKNVDSLGVKHPQSRKDTLGYSMIYILFNSGQDESKSFPMYFNGNYIFTMKNHMRLAYQMFSEGSLIIERKGTKASQFEPQIQFDVQQGKYYGVKIDEPYPQALHPNKMFSLTVIHDSAEIMMFLKKEFYGFKPFKDSDIKMKEDPAKPTL